MSLAVTPRLSYINKHSQLWLTVEVEHARACCHPSPCKGPSFAAAAAWPPVPPLVRLGTTSNSRPAWLCWQPKLSLFLIGHMCVTQVSITPRDGGRNPLPKLHTTHPTPPPGFLCTPSNTALPLLCTTQARATQANHNAVAHGCLLLAILEGAEAPRACGARLPAKPFRGGRIRNANRQMPYQTYLIPKIDAQSERHQNDMVAES